MESALDREEWGMLGAADQGDHPPGEQALNSLRIRFFR
jgi:hypothetical protein